MASYPQSLQAKIDERKLNGTYRSLTPENNLIDFCSNDYLGFARSARLKANFQQELELHAGIMNGSTGSRLLSGNLAYTEALERRLAAFHESEAALLFNSGYDANIGLLSSVPQKGDTIICDELVHASIIDGARLSLANRFTFRHNDLISLESKLKNSTGNRYVVVESVYSMDGDTPPLLEILALTEKYEGHLIVDEAHAAGLHPKGIVAHLGIAESVFARVVTFGKALGCHGAVVLGSTLLREYLVNFARSFIYTTAASFHQLASIKMAYELLDGASAEIGELKNNIRLFKEAMNNKRNLIIESDSAIQCLVLGSNEKAKQAAKDLQTAEMDVRPILSPTVAKGSERIRICLHAYNTANEISLLAETLNQIANFT